MSLAKYSVALTVIVLLVCLVIPLIAPLLALAIIPLGYVSFFALCCYTFYSATRKGNKPMK